MTNSIAEFQDDGDIKFPVITISVSDDDLNEPIHVDLGSIPPMVAASVLERVLSVLKAAVPPPKIMFKGHVLIEPLNASSLTIIDNLFESHIDEEDDNDQEDE